MPSCKLGTCTLHPGGGHAGPGCGCKCHEGEAVKTMGVKFAEIHYGCGCVSEMQKMVYCSVHSGQVNKAAVAEAVREAYERAAKDLEARCKSDGEHQCFESCVCWQEAAAAIRALSKGGGE